MNESNRSLRGRGLAALLAVAMAVVGLGASPSLAQEPTVDLWQATGSRASAKEPIVGLWQATASYDDNPLWYVIMAWTSDGLEVEDYALPILEGHICYGHWIKLHRRTYAQTHPYFEYNGKTGKWAGTSGLINYKITVSEDGKTFTGEQSGKSGVPGPDPYKPGGHLYSGITLTGTKVEIDKSALR